MALTGVINYPSSVASHAGVKCDDLLNCSTKQKQNTLLLLLLLPYIIIFSHIPPFGGCFKSGGAAPEVRGG